MKMKLQVTYNDGSAADVTVSAADLVAFEQEFDRSAAKFADEIRLTDICWLGWHALMRANETQHDFHQWLEAIDAVMPKEVQEIVPLDKTASIS